jgi:hypothetical protein
MHRASRDSQLGLPGRIPSYPLIEWGWNRRMCEDYIYAHLGVRWRKSACVMCTYALTSIAGRKRSLARYITDSDQALLPLLMEYVAVALNPRQGLIGGERLIDALAADPAVRTLLAQFDRHLDTRTWALYDVRRAFRAHKQNM